MTITEAPPTALLPGWLHRAWWRHLEAQDIGGSPRPRRHEYMCSSGMAEVLEPFVTVPPVGPVPGGRPEERILRFDGVDGAAAATFLERLPETALDQELSTFAPSARTMLTAVMASGGTVTCGGEVISPSLPMGGMRIRSLAVRDPRVLDQAPDVVEGTLPAWVEELPAAAARWYVQERQRCLDHGLTRQAWRYVSHHYAIDDARMFPATRILTDATGARVGVRFVW
ncbi:hypothetical protein [Pseudactinotalea sp.]|uniref:hypothetical protein n=1 Tax=Pseudactinotalea sp. TaxID=1926260 RepID=UPI003B3AC69A